MSDYIILKISKIYFLHLLIFGLKNKELLTCMTIGSSPQYLPIIHKAAKLFAPHNQQILSFPSSCKRRDK